MYKETFKKSQITNIPASASEHSSGHIFSGKESKINRICEAFLRALEKRPRTSLQNTITAHVCKSPPDLEGGLRIISKLKRALWINTFMSNSGLPLHSRRRRCIRTGSRAHLLPCR